MSIASLSGEIAAAIHNRLTTDPALTNILGDPVRAYDDVPPGAAFPYLTYGPLKVSDEGGDLVGLCRHNITLHVWSKYAGRQETFDILDAVAATLEASPLSLPSGHVSLAIIPFIDVLRAPDAKSRHGLLRLILYTEPEGETP